MPDPVAPVEKSPLNAGNRSHLKLPPKEPAAAPVPANITEPVAPSIPGDAKLPDLTPEPAPAPEPVPTSGPDPIPDPANEPNPVLADLNIDLGDPAVPEPDAEPNVDDEHLNAVEASMTNEQQREAFIKMRRELHEAKTALNTPAPAAVDDTRITEMQAELDAANDKLGKLSLQDHPDFKRKFDRPYENKLNEANRYAEAVGTNIETIKAAADMPLIERNEYIEQQFGNMAPTVMSILADMDGINAQRISELDDWQVQREEFAAKEGERASLIQGEMAKQTFSGAVAQLEQDEFLPFTYIEGNEAWNQNVDKIQAEAWALFQRDDLPAQAAAMARGVAAPHLLRSYITARTELAEAKRQLTLLGGAAPNLNGSPSLPAQPRTSQGPATAKEAGARAAARSHTLLTTPS